MHQKVEEGVHEKERNEQDDESVLGDSIGRLCVGRDGLDDGNDQAVGTDVAEMVVDGYEGDDDEGETGCPLEEDEKHEAAVGGGA